MNEHCHLLCLGFGFSAATLTTRLDSEKWTITGTSRSDAGVEKISAQGWQAIRYDKLETLPDDVTHLLSSVPPDEAGDPVLRTFGQELAARARQFQWVGYLSTTGVYGDHGGAWVDEDTPLTPNTERGQRRVAAEMGWQQLHADAGLPLQVFRLAGIYGPGRNALASLKSGKAQRIIRDGQIFSRIHVDDIAGILKASIERPNPGRIYNVADDNPAPPQDVIAHGAALLGMAIPPAIAFADAQLSPMARSFYADSKRVRNDRVKVELGYRFKYPDYRIGLQSLIANDTSESKLDSNA